MPALEHPIEIDTQEDAEAFYAFPEMLVFVAVYRALRKPTTRRASAENDKRPPLRHAGRAAA